MTEVRTFGRQVDIWLSAALACYGFRRSDVDMRVLKKCSIAGLALLRAHKPGEARAKIYDAIEREYQKSIWSRVVKTP